MSKTCGRCHEPIKPGDPYNTFSPDTASTAAPTVYLHPAEKQCTRVPHQAAPEQIRR
jgi:hypothetical protein